MPVLQKHNCVNMCMWITVHCIQARASSWSPNEYCTTKIGIKTLPELVNFSHHFFLPNRAAPYRVKILKKENFEERRRKRNWIYIAKPTYFATRYLMPGSASCRSESHGESLGDFLLYSLKKKKKTYYSDSPAKSGSLGTTASRIETSARSSLAAFSSASRLWWMPLGVSQSAELKTGTSERCRAHIL